MRWKRPKLYLTDPVGQYRRVVVVVSLLSSAKAPPKIATLAAVQKSKILTKKFYVEEKWVLHAECSYCDQSHLHPLHMGWPCIRGTNKRDLL